MSMPFAAQNQWKRCKNKVVFQSRPYAYESMSSYYSGVEKVCPWNPDFPVIHVFCKPLKLHNGRRAENCCRSYKRSRLSHEPLTPWALVLQVGTVGLQAGGRHQWPGGEVQVYHWGQDADVFIPLTSAAGLSLTSHFFCPKCCTLSEAAILERGQYRLVQWVLWLLHSECRGEWGYTDLTLALLSCIFRNQPGHLN